MPADEWLEKALVWLQNTNSGAYPLRATISRFGDIGTNGLLLRHYLAYPWLVGLFVYQKKKKKRFGQWLREEIGMFIVIHYKMKQESTENSSAMMLSFGLLLSLSEAAQQSLSSRCPLIYMHLWECTHWGFFRYRFWLNILSDSIICKVFAYMCSF